MNAPQWMTVSEAVDYLALPIERAMLLLDQERIESKTFDNGETLVSRDSCDFYMVNLKPKHNDAVRARATAEPIGEQASIPRHNKSWSKREIRYLRAHIQTEPPADIGLALGRKGSAVSEKWRELNCKSRRTKVARAPRPLDPDVPAGYVLVQAYAGMVGYSPSTIRHRAADGSLPSILVNGRLYIKEDTPLPASMRPPRPALRTHVANPDTAPGEPAIPTASGFAGRVVAAVRKLFGGSA